MLDVGHHAWKPGERAMKLQINKEIPYPYMDVSWALVATPDTSSWPHVDGEGVGTAVIVLSGLKLWCLARPKISGMDIDTVNAIPESFVPSEANTDLYEYEMVLLGQNDCL